MTHDRVGEGGLAGSVRPHQGVDLALRDLQVEPLEDLLALGAYVQVRDLQISHLSPLSWVSGKRAMRPVQRAALVPRADPRTPPVPQAWSRRAPWCAHREPGSTKAWSHRRGRR